MIFKSRTAWLIGFVLLLSVAGGVWYWQTSHSAHSQKKEELSKVFQANELILPTEQALSGRIEMSGVLVASEVGIVRSKTSGTLLRLNVQEGDAIKKGQILAELDVRDLAARTVERDAALTAAQRAHQLALSQHKANQDLAKQGFISETALASSQANLSAIWAQLKTAESALVAHVKSMDDASLKAPFDGVIARRLVNVGEKISMEQEVFSVMNPVLLEFKTMVDSSAAQFLRTGQSISIQLEGQAQPVAGQIQRIGPGNDAGARALPVFIKLVSSVSPSIRAGLMGTSQVTYALPQNGFTLPVTAVQEEGGKSIVWTIHEGLLKRQTVTLGMKDALGLHVYVLDGLKASDRVLALRFEGLKEGAKAEVKP
jgi:RND family efflux transporter MFP subunit